MHMYNVSTPKIDMNLTNCLMVHLFISNGSYLFWHKTIIYEIHVCACTIQSIHVHVITETVTTPTCTLLQQVYQT